MANAFQLEELDGRIGLLTFNVADKKVNTLGREILQELAGLAAQLEKRTDLRGLLLRSTKPGQFIAGADLNELAAMSYASADQVAGLLASGHQLFSRISRLPFPMVALIDGACMGGGTELALTMDERLVSTASHTQIGLPEVGLGLLPGWGGTQRLPRLIGLNAGIEMVCSSEIISGQKAVNLGFAFDAVPPEKLVEEGRRLIDVMNENGHWKQRRQKREQPLGLSADQVQFAFAVAEGAIKGKTKGQYPAPLVALKAIKDGCNLSLEEGLKVERKAFQELHGSPIMANLIAIFFMKNRLSRDPGVSNPAVVPKTVKRVGVSGAGLMGSVIVAAHARSGIPTAMIDIDDARLQDGLNRAQEVVKSRINIGRATSKDLANMLAALSTSTSTKIFADCDVVIEAVTENEAAQERGLQRACPGDPCRRNPGEQHLHHFHHPDGRVRSQARAVHRHAFFQSSRSNGAGGNYPRCQDQRRDGRDHRRSLKANPENTNRRQRLPRIPGQPRALPLHEREPHPVT